MRKRILGVILAVSMTLCMSVNAMADVQTPVIKDATYYAIKINNTPEIASAAAEFGDYLSGYNTMPVTFVDTDNCVFITSFIMKDGTVYSVQTTFVNGVDATSYYINGVACTFDMATNYLESAYINWSLR